MKLVRHLVTDYRKLKLAMFSDFEKFREAVLSALPGTLEVA